MTLQPSAIRFLWLLIVARTALFGAAPSAGAAVALTVTPSAVTNDFAGNIALTVTGLTPGASVQIEKLADFNGNAAVDAGDVLLQGYSVTDGSVSTIGGVRNLNVPGDADGLTNGVIRVELPLPGVSLPLNLASGAFVFRVSEVASGFPPVTQPFALQQKVLPQGVRGRVTTPSGQPLANALIVLSPLNRAGTLVALLDANGSYNFFSPAGSYNLVAGKDGFVSGPSGAAVNVVAGQFATNNLVASESSLTVSGRLMDSASGAGLPGVFLQGRSSTGAFSVTVTDSSGGLRLNATPGVVQIRVSDGDLVQLGYVTPQSGPRVNVSVASLANVNIAVAKANALFYGTVKDDLNRPLSGQGVLAIDQPGQAYLTEGRSLPSGSYTVAVLAGNWNLMTPQDAAGSQAIFLDGTNLTITAGQAVRVDFVGRRFAFTEISHLGGSANLTWNSRTGRTYRVQYKSSLFQPDWSDLMEVRADALMASVKDTSPQTPRFYRVLELP